MAHRKNIEYQLEQSCRHWGNQVTLDLVNYNNFSYVWNLHYKNIVYEITYSDLGEIAVVSTTSKIYPKTEVREIYSGDNSQISYEQMINVLSDNLQDYM